MSTFRNLTVQDIFLSIPGKRTEWTKFLQSFGLDTPSDPEFVAGIYDDCDKLAGTASLVRSSSGYTLQGVAVATGEQAGGLTGMLVQYLQQKVREYAPETQNILVFTKPEYSVKFQSLAFGEVGTAPRAVLLESNRRELATYVGYLGKQRKPGVNGAIVMNANPFTRGHRYLVQQAAAQVDNLYVIPVLDDTPGGFPYASRLQAIRQGVADIANVTVLEGSRYAVSAATFPTYFIKEVTDRTDTHIRLDLDIFSRHIAPALNAAIRFVGSEPTDALTARYNELMRELLPQHGIEVRLTERAGVNGEVISATRVRELLRRKDFAGCLPLLPPSTMAMVLGGMAEEALRRELGLHPKPGLVTPRSCGSHTDMDFRLMSRAITALRGSFEAFALQQLEDRYSHEALVAEGLKAEEAMNVATGNINTHRGAIFALGLTVAAASQLISRGEALTPQRLSAVIRSLAAPFSATEGTHGDKARREGKLRSALDMAQEGYSDVFDYWLPYLRSLPEADVFRLQRLLLTIMSTLDDTNVYHRRGAEASEMLKQRAKEALQASGSRFERRLDDLGRLCTSMNISPGGAADMLALTLLCDSLIPSPSPV